MKTRVGNEVANRAGAIYDENDNELSWPIGPSAICYESKREQQRD